VLHLPLYTVATYAVNTVLLTTELSVWLFAVISKMPAVKIS
jgi:hypothetical protein